MRSWKDLSEVERFAIWLKRELRELGPNHILTAPELDRIVNTAATMTDVDPREGA